MFSRKKSKPKDEKRLAKHIRRLERENLQLRRLALANEIEKALFVLEQNERQAA